jgi:uncharacterized membrane protein SpoIIM required for sporulation
VKETRFISQNKEKWRESEALLEAARKNPGKLSELFTQVIDDLSYSRTYYRNRSVRVYLNKIAREYFSIIYGNQRGKRGRFKMFWIDELPQIIIHSKVPLLISLVVFLLSVAVGVFSSIHDPEFTSTILGPNYVEMTKSNIEQGDPMAIYKKGHQVDMFLGITLNNMMVAFKAYVFGVLLSIGTIVIIISNGVMVGCFQYFFIQRDLFVESALTIWLHGTLEMSSFVIAGGAGLTLGSGLLFPGTYSRLQAFQISAIRSLKLMMSIAPILIAAALIESFLTRYTEVPDFVRILLIMMSATFIVGYYIIYPWLKSRQGFSSPIREVKLPPTVNQPIDFTRIKTNSDILKDSFFFYRTNFGKIIPWVVVISAVITTADVYFEQRFSDVRFYQWWQGYLARLFYALSTPSWIFVALNSIGTSLIVYRVMKLADRDVNPGKQFVELPMILQTMIVMGLVYTMFLFLEGWGMLIFSLSFMLITLVVYVQIAEQTNLFSALSRAWTMATADFGQFAGLHLTILLMAFSFLLILSAPLIYLYSVVFQWTFTQSDWWSKIILQFVELFIKIFSFNLVLPLIAASVVYLYYSMKELSGAGHLKKAISGMAARYSKPGDH